MKIYSILAAIFLTSGFVLCVCSEEYLAVGQVIAITGRAVAVNQNNIERVLELKSPISVKDRIKTGKGCRLQVLMNDDTVISIGENSEVLIDEYLYDPKDEAKSSAFIRMIQGVFRMVTGRITKVNPDKFKVQTRLATIGIRGCAIGFLIMGQSDIIYIIQLLEGENVLIEYSEIQEGISFMKRAIIDKSGSCFEIGESGGRYREDITDTVIDTLTDINVFDTTTTEKEESKNINQPEGIDGGTQVNKEDEKSDTLALLVQSVDIQQEREPVEEKPLLYAGDRLVDHWWWKIWSDGKTEFGPNFDKEDKFVSSDEYNQLIAGSIPVNLVGRGKSGAVIFYRDGKIPVTGDVNLNVWLNSPEPGNCGWEGVFNMGNITKETKLNFHAYGFFDNEGGMRGNVTTEYLLTIKGISFDHYSIKESDIRGRLIRAPRTLDGNIKINGAAGKFYFLNEISDKMALVKGAYGSNLSPVSLP